jgi:hypothetical protein
VLAIGILGCVIYTILDTIFEPIRKVVHLKSIDETADIYLYKRIFGVTGSREEFIISSRKMLLINVDVYRDYYIYNSGPIFYRFVNDTLFVYTRDKMGVPEVFDSRFTIIQLHPPMWNDQEVYEKLRVGDLKSI